MKLTKLQRHTAYIIMLSEYERGYCNGFCSLTRDLFDWNNNNEATHGAYNWALYNLDYLPELLRKKPNPTYSAHWFPLGNGGTPLRMELLKQCIEETY